MSSVPARRLVVLLACASPLFLIDPLLAVAVDLVILAAATMDAARARSTAIRVHRRAPARIAHGAVAEVWLHVVNASPRTVRLAITDDLPPQLVRIDASTSGGDEGGAVDPANARWAMTLAADGEHRVRYHLLGAERGPAPLSDIHLRVLGPLGLVWHQRREGRSDPLHVQPGLRDVRRYRLLAHRHRLREIGLRSMRERGEGSSFESLREYVRGDDPRRLDWKASARRGELMVRQMETERSQNVVLGVDLGRLMGEELDGPGAGSPGRVRDARGVRRERLDSALAAALLLAEVALQHGDRVGLLLFSSEIHLYLPPARSSLERLANAMAEVRPRPVESDYAAALTFLARQLRRRSLVVVLTDVIDSSASAELLAHTGALARRHLPLVITIRNPALESAAAAPVQEEMDAYRRAAAEEVLHLRARALASMRSTGALIADTLPGDVVATAVNRYLEVKRRGRI